MTTVIALAVPETVPQFVASVAALFDEDGGRRDPHMDTGWPKRDGADYYLAATRDAKCLCLLAQRGRDQQRIVGHLIARVARPNPLRPDAVQVVLESMRVDPTHRLQGVGALLVNHFREWGRSEGANEASVTAYAANASAVQFYRRCGFEPFELTLHMAL
jgi:GNAT superfamily N-acetyltransferase